MMMYDWSDLNVRVTELSVAGRAVDLQTEAQVFIHSFQEWIMFRTEYEL